MNRITLGYAPTRRNLFSAEEAVRYAGLVRSALDTLSVPCTGLEGVCADGLLFDERDVPAAAAQLRGVDGLFVPHVGFGTEFAVARLAKELGVPVLLWGPRDDAPTEDGMRLRDTQCGLFATGKVLRRFGVPFTYLKNCRIEDPAFAQGIALFHAVCNVVKAFRSLRILQISTRPTGFLSVLCNEGELLERFGIEVVPVALQDLASEMERIKREQKEAVAGLVSYFRENMDVRADNATLEQIAAMKLAMGTLIGRHGCSAAAVQCWDAMQEQLGVMPCAAHALLCDEGIPVACETDIHGAITSVLVQAAGMGRAPTLFADWTVRHPEEDIELLQHCGPWPPSLAVKKPVLGRSVAFEHPGSLSAPYPNGALTLARFDGDNGEYSLLLGNAEAVDGPYTMGTYLWVRVENLDRLEEKLVRGPYVHHCTGIYGDVVPVLYEACRYIGVTPDLYDAVEETVKAKIRGEVDYDFA